MDTNQDVSYGPEHVFSSSSSLVFTFFFFHCLLCPLQDVVLR